MCILVIRPRSYGCYTQHTSQDRSRVTIQPFTIQQSKGNWEQRYDFHWCDGPIPRALGLHRENQQDALRFRWPADGLVAGTDAYRACARAGSLRRASSRSARPTAVSEVQLEWKQERMVAGYVAGNDPIPLVSL
jgi:hypothetical protein